MKLDAFTRQYIATALWSSNDESDESGGSPLDENYSADDLSPEALAEIVADCVEFRERCKTMLLESANDDAQAGHDFWLTRNGHGVGFWDGDWPEHGEALTAISEEFGNCDLYIGDDGKLYVA